ncbi:hypothetical protein IAR55_003735 [Kwoniella newhampshirensis]|uniref:Amino acid permease/ SLC12A domain-containing protein n=1 Tax=Kwoniella newhampshirensis TaxID=1651941 RepID=A0AAW0YKA1_9TREE
MKSSPHRVVYSVQIEPNKDYVIDVAPLHTLSEAESRGDYIKGREIAAGDMGTENEERDLRRGLAQRHISMIALAGSIGTGLFLSLGGAIQKGGPLGALLGYAFIGVIVCVVQFALGEVTALLPVTGSFVRHAEFLSDPALGFALGWNIVYGNWLSIPSEISAICVLFQYWTDLNSSVFIVIFILLTAFVGLVNIRWYGEIECFFAMLKIFLVVGLILLGLIIDLGGVSDVARIGFRHWKTPGPFVENVASGHWGKILGFWSVMINAVFSFAGVESVAMAAAEINSPRRNIPKACKRVFARVALFYVLGVLIVGVLVASDDPALSDDSGTAATSPFVIAASAAGIKAIPSIALLAGTRVLYGIALKGQAPKVFLRTNRWGTPYVCVAIYIAFSFLAFMSLSNGGLTVFYWLLDLVGCGVLISWSAILFNHLRLVAAMRKQKVSRRSLPWWTPYSAAAALFMCVIILLANGWTVFTHGGWSAAGFVTSYLDIPLVLVAYLAWRMYKRDKFVSLSVIPVEEVLKHIVLNPEEPEEKFKGWTRYLSFLWD